MNFKFPSPVFQGQASTLPKRQQRQNHHQTAKPKHQQHTERWHREARAGRPSTPTWTPTPTSSTSCPWQRSRPKPRSDPAVSTAPRQAWRSSCRDTRKLFERDGTRKTIVSGIACCCRRTQKCRRGTGPTLTSLTSASTRRYTGGKPSWMHTPAGVPAPKLPTTAVPYHEGQGPTLTSTPSPAPSPATRPAN